MREARQWAGLSQKNKKGGEKMISGMLIEFEFACPYQLTCAQTQKIKDLCLEKMRVIIFKLYESDEKYSWLPLVNFCNRQPERHHILNALGAEFGVDLSFDLKERSVLNEKSRR